MRSTNIAVLLVVLLPLVTGTCTKASSACAFSCGTNKMLDLSPLARTDSKPAFQDQIDSSGTNMYSFSPCSTFSEGAGCKNVSVCQVQTGDKSGPSTIPVGTLDSMQLSDDGTTLTYSATSDAKRTAIVHLKCDSSVKTPQLTVMGQIDQAINNYIMNLTTQHACMFDPTKTSSARPEVTTAVTTETSNTTAPNAVTTAANATVIVTTAQANATTSPLNVTTAVTNHTMPVTTEPSKNVTVLTTMPPTTENVTTAVKNVTMPAGNTTSQAPSNVTTQVVTIVTSPVTSPVDTTTHHGFAPVTRSAGWLVAVLVMAARLVA